MSVRRTNGTRPAIQLWTRLGSSALICKDRIVNVRAILDIFSKTERCTIAWCPGMPLRGSEQQINLNLARLQRFQSLQFFDCEPATSAPFCRSMRPRQEIKMELRSLRQLHVFKLPASSVRPQAILTRSIAKHTQRTTFVDNRRCESRFLHGEMSGSFPDRMKKLQMH